MKTPKLSICIPTYNRLSDLKVCLDYVMPQVESLSPGLAEVVIVNNASTDGTAAFIDQLAAERSYVRSFHNASNLGFDGNTAKCIEHAQGEYAALLSDDDRYLPGAVETILSVIDKKEYVLINLNYYGFLGEDVDRPSSIVAPDHDVEFERAFDVMNYPSVGHFSGFIYRSASAKRALDQMLARDPRLPVDHSSKPGEDRARRGIYFELAIRMAASSGLPSYFIGARKLATKVQTDHCGVPMGALKVREICLDYYHLVFGLHKEGLLSDADLEYRKALVLSWLPRVLVRNAGYASRSEMVEISDELSAYFHGDKRFSRRVVPLLWLARYRAGRFLFRLTCWLRGFAVRMIRVVRH